MQEESDTSCNTRNKIEQFEEFTDTSEQDYKILQRWWALTAAISPTSTIDIIELKSQTKSTRMQVLLQASFSSLVQRLSNRMSRPAIMLLLQPIPCTPRSYYQCSNIICRKATHIRADVVKVLFLTIRLPWIKYT